MLDGSKGFEEVGNVGDTCIKICEFYFFPLEGFAVTVTRDAVRKGDEGVP